MFETSPEPIHSVPTNRPAGSHSNASRRWLWSINAFLCIAIALFSYRYLASVGPMPENIVGNAYFAPWLAIHVIGAATALLVAPLQFVKTLRSSRPQVHRWLGRIYGVGCMIGGVSGLVLAAGITAGPVAATGFGMLGVAWIVTTGVAWRAALTRDFVVHRQWMIRSFALTLAAVTLRVYLGISESELLPISPETAYIAISFVCWVPNAIAAEIYLRRMRQKALA